MENYDFDDSSDASIDSFNKRSKTTKDISKILIPPANEWTEDVLELCNLDFDITDAYNFIYTKEIPAHLKIFTDSKDFQEILYQCSKDIDEIQQAKIKLHKMTYNGQPLDSGLKALVHMFATASSSLEFAESNVDMFTRMLYDIIGFEDYTVNTSIVGNVATKLNIFGEILKVTPDVSVIQTNLKTIKPNIQLLSCENKSRANEVKLSDIRAQAIAEMLAAYQTNASNFNKNKIIQYLFIDYKFPFITVHGGQFSFYIVDNMTADYLDELKTAIPCHKLTISVLRQFQNFSDFTDRKRIIQLLLYFKECVSKHSLDVTKALMTKIEPSVKKPSSSSKYTAKK